MHGVNSPETAIADTWWWHVALTGWPMGEAFGGMVQQSIIPACMKSFDEKPGKGEVMTSFRYGMLGVLSLGLLAACAWDSFSRSTITATRLERYLEKHPPPGTVMRVETNKNSGVSPVMYLPTVYLVDDGLRTLARVQGYRPDFKPTLRQMIRYRMAHPIGQDSALDTLVSHRRNLRLVDRHNRPQRLQDLIPAGGIAVVNYWAHWSIPCKRVNQELKELSAEFPRDRVRFLSVNIDKIEGAP